MSTSAEVSSALMLFLAGFLKLLPQLFYLVQHLRLGKGSPLHLGRSCKSSSPSMSEASWNHLHEVRVPAYAGSASRENHLIVSERNVHFYTANYVEMDGRELARMQSGRPRRSSHGVSGLPESGIVAASCFSARRAPDMQRGDRRVRGRDTAPRARQ
jgi:hypothetical protein